MRRFTLLTLLFVACASDPYAPAQRSAGGGSMVSEMMRATDANYGWTEQTPVKVGGGFDTGVRRSHEFLAKLRGPNGEKVRYNRAGSCCHFETPNGIQGMGLLDRWELTWDGLAEPKQLYINWYDEGPPMIPAGLTIAR